MWGLLKPIRCELWKVKRRKFVSLTLLFAFLFPIPLTYMMTTPSMASRSDTPAEAFDSVFNFVLGYGVQFLLPAILGVLAAILFFMERDSDTFKSLRTIPVTSRQMIFAKMVVLFLYGILFSIASLGATLLCSAFLPQVFEITGLWYKLVMSVEMGVFITAGTLPLIILIVFFSKTYVFSVLLCIFYSVLNLSATSLFEVLPKAVTWILPGTLTTFWSAGNMVAHGIDLNVKAMTDLGLIPSTLQTVAILAVMGSVSIALIIRMYERRNRE
ncbi:ABC transporter permease [Desulfotruncus arcticus]|uniref:ABC transporter permease n=1 Tax=Desulfotruncus arcticus TaxID=341036 RepID=UPI003EB94685